MSLSATGRAIYTLRMPAHLCFAIALVERVEETTAEEIRSTNPFGHSVDLLWYEIPVAYDLSQQRLLYYSKAASLWENFRGEIAWKQLRSVIQQVLMSRLFDIHGNDSDILVMTHQVSDSGRVKSVVI